MGQERTARETPGFRRRSVLATSVALGVAAPLAGQGQALAQSSAGGRHGSGGSRPSERERWDTLHAKLAAITGVWTDENYVGGVNNTMPDTALLGNGDVGVTSGGSPGVKTFRIAKGDFWNGNPGPVPAAVGGVSIGSAVPQDFGNLARGATATASASHDAFTPDRAVSGQWTGGYEGWVSPVGKPQWIALDLGSEQTIARWVVRNDEAARPGNRSNNTKDLVFQTSADGASWQDVDAVTGNSAPVIDRDIARVTARHVRFFITEPTQADTEDSTANPRARVGQIELYAETSAENPNTPPEGAPFREEQHILDGRITTKLTIDGTPLELTTRLAAERNVLVTTLTSRGDAPLRLQLSTWAGTPIARAQYTNASGADGSTLWAERTTAPGDNWVSKAVLATRVLGASVETPEVSGATVKTYVTVRPGRTIDIVTAIAGGGRAPRDPKREALALAGAQNSRSLRDLDSRRVAWWKEYWLRSDVHLGKATLERFYYAAQYFLGASSRPGKVSPGLYGLWTTTDFPQFSGDLHLNYNAQAPFYGVYSSNRPELVRPFHQAILEYVPEAKRRAREDLRRLKEDYIDARFPSGGLPGGVFFPVGIGPWGSTTDNSYWQQVSNSLFSASQFVEYYEYTLDRDFLREELYPFLSEVAEFFEHYLEYDASARRYVLWSGPHEGSWGKDSTADIGLLRQTLGALIKASEELRRDAGRRRTWQHILDRLAEPATGEYDGRTVYTLAEAGSMVGDTRDIRPGDNTVNLEFIHPADYLGVTSDEERRQIAIDTLDVMNSWGNDNSFPKVFTQAARIGYPAQSLIDRFVGVVEGELAANLRIRDPHHGIEKSGATEAVNSMLVQSHDGVVSLFPVWPSDADAHFNDLRLPGAFLVSSALKGGTVRYAEFTSEAGGTLKLANPWRSDRVSVTDSRGHRVDASVRHGVITVRTGKGRTYRVTPR
ncbi:discoidin domain-containing protein [Streptomyces avicenniae]|uniref:discoidin domain-containing protein n=1 Tax=Streptomyces avicenniae TaxID=500153 RepID=UPI000DA62BDB|nr:discoidin domain-containing protein [Streptomyces avicenniae]